MICQLIKAYVSYFCPHLYNKVYLFGSCQMAIIVTPATVAVCPKAVIKGFPSNARFILSRSAHFIL